MRAERSVGPSLRPALGSVLALLVACGPARVLTHPEGDGGWSAERRQRELAERAAAAEVPLDPTAAPAEPVETPLTLAEAVALAASGNRRIADAARGVDAAAARVRDTRGRLLPAVTGNGRYTWYSDPLTNQIATSVVFPGGITPAIVIREKESGNVHGIARVPLDLSGELWNALTASQAAYRGEEARRWATSLAEQASVTAAYFTLLESQRLRTVTEQQLIAQRAQETNARQRYDTGRLTKNELLVVQVAVRDAEQRLLQREIDIDRARWTLNELIGRPVDAPTTVVDVGGRPDIPSTPEALRDAYAHNPRLAALIEEQQRLEDTARSLVRSRLPRFEGGGGIDWTNEEILQPQRIESGFVGFTWDLGTDGRREAQIAEARIAADRNRIAIEQELRALEHAVRATQRAAEERLAALESAEAAVGQAEENLRIRQQQFDAGRATSEDVLDAEALLTSQRATLASALYQAHTRRAELQQLMGLPVEALAARTR